VSAAMFIGIGVLGGVGALLRFVLDGAISTRIAGAFPWGTFAVNVIGALALGVVIGAGMSGDGLRLVSLGLLGGLTTFSTWVFESQRLAEAGLARLGLLNFALSLVFGIGAVWLGQQIGGLL